MKMRKLALTVILVLCVITLCACAPKTPLQSIQGAWVQNSDESYAFQNGEQKGPLFSHHTSFNFKSDSTVNVGEATPYHFTIEGNTLTISSPFGSSQQYNIIELSQTQLIVEANAANNVLVHYVYKRQ